MVKKPSIQKAILKTLSKKGLTSLDSIKKDVENVISNQCEEPNKVNYAIARSLKNLLSDGLIETFNSDNNKYVRLTKEGKQKLNNIAIECEAGLVSLTWDGYWRIIILDLPEERKNEREALRYLLKKAGFACIKNSVWISIYPYENLFTNIKKDLGLTSEMMIIVTDKIDEMTKQEFLNLI
jgi:DNA-binding transcriptional regulator PaaX